MIQSIKGKGVLAVLILLLVLLAAGFAFFSGAPAAASSGTAHITFDKNHADAVGVSYQQTVTAGEPVRLAAVRFQNPGYRFLGWSLAATEEVALEDAAHITAPATDITLYAVWQEEIYTVTFNKNLAAAAGEMAAQSFNALAGAKALAQNAFTAEGYVFAGWAFSPDAGAALTDGEAFAPTANVDLYAVWQPYALHIAFLDDGLDAALAQTVAYGIPAPLNPVFATKAGYLFAGWARTQNGAVAYRDGELYTHADASADGQTITLYAKWTPITYTVLFDANGGTGSLPAQTHTYDVKQNLWEGTNLKNTGYLFAGWNTQPNATGEYYFPVMPAPLNLSAAQGGSVTLYAVWTEANVVLYDGNGSGYHNELPVLAAAPTPPAPTGYTFVKWTTARDGSGTAYNAGASVDTAGILYAQYAPVSYTIAFHKNHAEAAGTAESLAMTYDKRAYLPQKLFARAGYVLIGWNTQADGAGDSYAEGEAVLNLTAVNETVTLYAVWEKEKYALTYDTRGGLAVVTAYYAENSSVVVSAATSKIGYIFLGWEDADGIPVTAFAMPAESMTVFAVWEARAFSVSFDPKGGVPVAIDAIENAKYESAVTPPADPTRPGYIFTGWYEGETAVEPFQFSAMPMRAVALEARWSPNIYTVSFYSDGEKTLADMSAYYLSDITLPTPEKLGYAFTGWYRDAACTMPASYSRMPAQNLNVYAGWNETEYTVRYETNGAGIVADGYYTYTSTALTLPQDPVRAGYVFGGWYLNETFTIAYDAEASYADNLILYAKWTLAVEKAGFPVWAIVVISVVGALGVAGAVLVVTIKKKREKSWNSAE